MGYLRRLRADQRGVGFIEFALALPLVLGFCLCGLEMASFVLQVNKAQRLATMLADLLAQQGQGNVEATEAQVYDLFAALKVSAAPIDMINNGRVVLTVAKGVDLKGDGTISNQIVDQQFDGGLVSIPVSMGCHTNNNRVPTLNPIRTLAKDEILVHAQVTFQYKPLFLSRPFDMLNLPTTLTRTAGFRARRSDFAIQQQAGYPMKTNCFTKDGLPTTTL